MFSFVAHQVTDSPFAIVMVLGTNISSPPSPPSLTAAALAEKASTREAAPASTAEAACGRRAASGTRDERATVRGAWRAARVRRTGSSRLTEDEDIPGGGRAARRRRGATRQPPALERVAQARGAAGGAT